MESSDLIERIQAAKDKVQDREKQRAILEDRLEGFKDEIDKFKGRCTELDVKPGELDEAIAKAESHLLGQLALLETALADGTPAS